MSRFLFPPFSVLAAIILALITASVSAQFQGLTTRIPSDANAIVILHADKVMNTPLAQRENWREERSKAAAAGLTMVPEAATEFVMAAKLDLEFMEPLWEVALSNLNYEPSMPRVAARWGGQVDRVVDRNAVLLPDDTYVVQLSKNKVASMRPANRQRVARWLRQMSTTDGSHLSPYLQHALEYAQGLGTPIVMAIDLEQMLSTEFVKQRLQEFDSVGKDVNIDEVAKALAGVQGITLGLNITDHVSGAIVIDFAGDVSALKGIAKPVLLEVLANQSAMIDEFNDWKAIVEDKRIRIGGRLTESGTRRIMSILDAPASLQDYAPRPDEEPDPQTEAKLASQQYFGSVTGLVDDLQGKSGAKTSGQAGMWWDRYARKIDKLPMLSVDDVLLDYGGFVSSSLREGSATLRNVGGKSRTRQLNEPRKYNTYSRWGGVGYYGGGYSVAVEDKREEAHDRARIKTEERVQGSRQSREIMGEINQRTGEVRRAMTEKYKAEF